MSEREYVLPLDMGVQVRCAHRIEKGRVVGFMVQLEVKEASRWEHVIRYDTAHGFAHCDRYRKDGAVIKTEVHLQFNEARTFAEADIRKRWRMYVKAYRGG